MHQIRVTPLVGDDYSADCIDCPWHSRGSFDATAQNVRKHGIVYAYLNGERHDRRS